MVTRVFRILLFLFVLTVCFFILNVSSADVLYSGTAGSYVEWSVLDDGCLLIQNNSATSTGILTNPSSTSYQWPWYAYRNDVTRVVVDGSVVISSYGYNLFSGLANCTSFDLHGLSFGSCDYLNNMFSGCSSLVSIDLSYITTGSPLSCASMFADCSSLESFDLSGIHFSSVKDVSGMFSGCTSLTDLDLSDWTFTALQACSGMFSGCSSLTSLNLDGWNLSNANSSTLSNAVGGMFQGCNALTNVSLKNWVVPSNCNSAIGNAGSLKSPVLDVLDVTGWKTSNVVNMSNLFQNCTAKSIVGLDTWNTSNVTTMQSMFYDCANLVSFDVSKFDMRNVYNVSCMFYGCTSLEEMDISMWDKSYISSAGAMFQKCSSLKRLDVSNWKFYNRYNIFGSFANGCTSLKQFICKNWWNFPSSLGNFCEGLLYLSSASSLDYIDVTGWDLSGVTGAYRLFANMFGREIRGLDTWTNMSGITTMEQMFYNCNRLESLDLSAFDTSNVTTMYLMFYGCSSLKNLDLSSFVTSKLTSMYVMFGSCTSLESIDLSMFDTSKVTRMEAMFSGCTSLKKADLSGFDFSSISETGYLSGMFSGATLMKELIMRNWKNMPASMVSLPSTASYNASVLDYIDVAGWDLSGVTSVVSLFDSGLQTYEIRGLNTWVNMSDIVNMGSMFAGCSLVERLDVENFDVSNVENFSSMFAGCTGLKYLDLSMWDVSNATNMGSMFGGCTSLRKVKLGPGFDFKAGSDSTSYWGLLPTPSSDDPYNGSWIRSDDLSLESIPYVLSRDYDSSYAGTWIWSMQDIFDGSDMYVFGSSTNESGVIVSSDPVYVDFTNVHIVVPTSVSFRVYKEADFEYNSGDFEFQLLDERGTVLQTITNSFVTNGLSLAVFDFIDFDSEGDYKYYIREVNGSLGDWILYDDSIFEVDVTVRKNAKNCLTADVVYNRVL